MSEFKNEDLEMGSDLIAGFMGLKCPPLNGIGYYSIDELEYKCSWDWLMPVIAKIHSIEQGNPSISIQRTRVGIWYYYLDGTEKFKSFVFNETNTPLICAYNAVLQFIEWHEINKQLIQQTTTI